VTIPRPDGDTPLTDFRIEVSRLFVALDESAGMARGRLPVASEIS
jgi:hypothetical protein